MNCAPTGNPLIGLSEEALARVNALADVLREVQIVQNVQAVQNVAARLGVSTSTVRAKIKRLDKFGLAGLVRQTRSDRGRARVADEKIIARIKAEYLKP